MIKNLTPDQAWQSIRQFCGYRERCHFEVKEKLFGLGLVKKEVETLICRRIEEDYLNEERFAIQFAGGHFRINKWGKMNIVYELRQKRVGENIIKRALKEIEEADYVASLQKLARAKWNSLKGEQWLSRQAKTRAYLLQKGYEAPAIQQVIAGIRSGIPE